MRLGLGMGLGFGLGFGRFLDDPRRRAFLSLGQAVSHALNNRCGRGTPLRGSFAEFVRDCAEKINCFEGRGVCVSVVTTQPELVRAAADSLANIGTTMEALNVGTASLPCSGAGFSAC